MKKLLTLLGILALWTNGIGQVIIDPNTTYQTITGFGSMVPSNDEIYDLGVSMSRQDWSPEYNSGLGPANVNTEPGSWTFTHNANYITQIKKARALDPNFVVIATIWSPPFWLKRYDKNLYKPGDSTNRSAGGYLDPTKYDKFGEWVAQATLAFKAQYGFDLYAVSPQNEPEFAEPYGSCVYNATQLKEATKKIGQKFAAHSITNTKIFHGEILPAQKHVVDFFSAVNNDPETEAYVSAFAIHNYDQDGIRPGGAGCTEWSSFYTESQRTTHKKQLWMTETSGYATDIIGGITIGAAIFNALNCGNINLWSHFYLGKGNDMTDHVYYVHKQYFRFIRPGAIRLKATSSDANILSLAFKNTAQNSFTIILINNGSTDKTMNITLPSSPGTFDMFRTSNKELCQFVGQTNLTSINLPKMSIMTLVNVSSNKLPTINKLTGTIGDTIIIVKSVSDKSTDYNLSGITDGGEGNQTIKVTTELLGTGQGGLFSSANVTYTSPNTTGVLTVTQQGGKTGNGWVRVVVDDQSTACNGFYSKKELVIPFKIIPFINIAPTFDVPETQIFKTSELNQERTIILQSVTDGNGNVQSKYLTVTSSDPSIVKVVTMASSSIFKLVALKSGTATISVTIKDNGDTYLGGANSTTKTFSAVVEGNIGITNVDEKMTFDIFPNPAKDFIIITNPDFIYQNAIVYDINGSALSNTILTDGDNTVNTKLLPSGLYIIKLFNGENIVTKKFNIVR